MNADTTKFSSELKKTLVWFSETYRRLKKHEHTRLEQNPNRPEIIYRVPEPVSRHVDIDYFTSRNALLRLQTEWPLLEKLDMLKRGDEIQARMQARKRPASSDQVGKALDKLAAEVQAFEKDLSDLGAKIAAEEPQHKQ